MWFLCPVGFLQIPILRVCSSCPLRNRVPDRILLHYAGYRWVPVELIEYMWQAGFTDTDSVVGNGDTDPVCLCLCLYGDITRFVSRIFHCIIDQVPQHIIEMRTVCKYCNVVRDIYGNVDRLTGF